MTQLAPDTDARLTQLAEDLSALMVAYSGRQAELVGALRELRLSCAQTNHALTADTSVAETAVPVAETAWGPATTWDQPTGWDKPTGWLPNSDIPWESVPASEPAAHATSTSATPTYPPLQEYAPKHYAEPVYEPASYMYLDDVSVLDDASVVQRGSVVESDPWVTQPETLISSPEPWVAPVPETSVLPETSVAPDSLQAQAVGYVLDRRFSDSGIGPLKRDYDYFAELEAELLAIGVPISERWEPEPDDSPSISSEAPMTVATEQSVATDQQSNRTAGSASTWTAVQMPTPEPAGAPAPGELSIRGRTAWKTWHVLGLAACCLLAGMALDYFAGPSTAVKAASTSNYVPPPAATGSSAGAAGTGTAGTASGTGGTATSASGGTSSTATTVPTTGAGSTTSTTVVASPAASGVAVVLVPAYQGTGNWSGQSFSVASGTWDVGWAYRCTPVPTSGASLNIFVSPQGGPASQSPAIAETGASGSNISTETTSGPLTVSVQAPPGCVWKIKVTGVGTPS